VSLAILEPEHLQTLKANFQVNCGDRQEALQRMQADQHNLGRV